ncbi:MAG: hypothetical protein ABIL62_05435 [Planctomycetota bacterium]
MINLYINGITRNLHRFEENIRQQYYDNPTVRPSVNSTLAAVLGHEAGKRNTLVTWEQIIAEKRRIEPDLTGLRQ